MKITCEYCGNNINSTDDVCPHCGAPNTHVMRTATGEPKTIEELAAYFEKNGISEEKTRFFIGKDTNEARAFGIFKDENGVVTVYKNKSDGSRAVRYEGTDEAFAVNEIYQKFIEERSKQIAAGNVTQKRSAQHSSSGSRGSGNSGNKRRKKGFFGHLFTPRGTIFLIVFILILIYGIGGGIISYNANHYSYHSTPYYYDDGYDYDDSYTDYGYDYDYDYDYNDSDSSWSYDSDYDYDSGWDSWDSDWDSGYDYDYDSWDSWDSGWDSDW